MKQDYITQDDRDYIVNCKLKLKGIIDERGWSVEALTLETGTPDSTIYNWLDVNQLTFPLPGISVLCRAMKISMQDVLADPMWITIDEGRYLFVRPWMEEPIEIVRLVTEFYFKMKEEFKNRGI